MQRYKIFLNIHKKVNIFFEIKKARRQARYYDV